MKTYDYDHDTADTETDLETWVRAHILPLCAGLVATERRDLASQLAAHLGTTVLALARRAKQEIQRREAELNPEAS